MNQKEIDAYRKIAAPSTLKQRILAESDKETVKFRRNAKICYGIAALCAALVLVFTFYPTAKTTLFYNSGELLSDATVSIEMLTGSHARTVSQDMIIPFTLDTNTKTVVSVSQGSIIIDGEDMGQKTELKKDTDFFWSVSIDKDNKEYSLTLDNKKEKSTYCISKNETDGFFIKKIN